MEIFSKLCCICAENSSILRNIRNEKETLGQFNNMLRICFQQIYIENDIPVYLCNNCCNKLTYFNDLKELFVKNLIHLRKMYIGVKWRSQLAKYSGETKEKLLKKFPIENVTGRDKNVKKEKSVQDEVGIKAENDDSSSYASTQILDLAGKKNYYNGNSIDCQIPLSTNKESIAIIEVEEDATQDKRKAERNENQDVYFTDIENEIPATTLLIYKAHNIRETNVNLPFNSLTNYEERSSNFSEENDEEMAEDRTPINNICTWNVDEENKAKEAEIYLTEDIESSLQVFKIFTSTMNKTDRVLHPCPTCQQTFEKASGLALHVCPHSNKNHLCPICWQKFRNHCDLYKHAHTHTKTPHVCKICGKTFSTIHNILLHNKDVHLTGKYTCQLCQRQFHRLYDFKKHTRIHTTSDETHLNLAADLLS